MAVARSTFLCYYWLAVSFHLGLAITREQRCSYTDVTNAQSFQVVNLDSKNKNSSKVRFDVDQCASLLDIESVSTACAPHTLRLKARLLSQREDAYCTVSQLNPLSWPRDKTIWIVGDSVVHQLFVSLICQLAIGGKKAGLHSAITYPYGNNSNSKLYCLNFLGTVTAQAHFQSQADILAKTTGKVCMYYAGCFTGSCFRSDCPHAIRSDATLSKKQRKRLTEVPGSLSCIPELRTMTRDADYIFLGLNAHFRQDEAKLVVHDLQSIQKGFLSRILSNQTVHWLSTTAQHFPTKSCRLTSKLNVNSRGCTSCQTDRNLNIVDVLVQRLLFDKRGIKSQQRIASLVPLNLASAPAWPALHPPDKLDTRMSDCTHYCRAMIDLLSDIVALAL
jgi:hypothetical protein